MKRSRGKQMVQLALENQKVSDPSTSYSDVEDTVDSGSEYFPDSFPETSDSGKSFELSTTADLDDGTFSKTASISLVTPLLETMPLLEPMPMVCESAVICDSEKSLEPSGIADLDDACFLKNDSISPLIPLLEPMPMVSESEVAKDNIPHVKIKGRVRRKHRCLYCDQDVGNFSRHLERNHADEIDVQELMNQNKKSKTRKKLVDKLRREGDFRTSKIVPVMSVANTTETNYIACKFCWGYYSRKSLRRHAKKCYFNPDPSKRFNAQSEGQTIMVGSFGPNDPLRFSGLLNMMRADDVTMTAKKDAIICEVGRRYIRSHKEKHLLIVAKRNMRRLARLLISVRGIENNRTFGMIDILTPHKFKSLIRGTHQIAEYNYETRTFNSPSLALQMGTLIKSAIDAAYSTEVQKENSSKGRLEQLRTLTTLIETDWSHQISSEAGQNLAINKFNKPTLIPITEDIMKFEKYLKQLIIKSKTRLAVDSKDIKAYRDLLDGIFCSVMVFNKRRVGELQRMTLQTFLKNYETSFSSEFQKALSESEKILCKSLKRVVIRGKRGRGVPVLFDRTTVESIEFSITLRSNFDYADNVYLFGIPGTKNPITGTSVMRKHAKLALGDGNKAALLTSTKLRKHLATIMQILKMEKTELEQLATFMGHTEKTHSEFYRLPNDVYQTAKISKLLLLAKGNSLDQYKGKRLADIEIDEHIVEDDETDDEICDRVEKDLPSGSKNRSEILEESNLKSTEEDAENSIIQSSKIKKGKKRTLVAWTDQQKTLTEKFFKDHIQRKIPPKKHEVLKLIEKNPQVFENKSWQVIKVYVCNKYKKK